MAAMFKSFASVLRLMKAKWTDLPPSHANLTGRIAIVIGANIGIGYETALGFLKMNPQRLILAVRSVEKGNEAASKMRELVPDSRTQIDVWELDLARFDSVKSFIGKVNAELPRLDILVENAAVAFFDRRLTADGHEIMSQVNVLSMAAIALSLLPKLNMTSKLPTPSNGQAFKPRLVGVVGAFPDAFGEREQPSILQALDDDKVFQKYGIGGARYPTTKLLDLFLVREVAKLPQAQNILVSAAQPGFTYSGLRRSAPAAATIPLWIFETLAARTTEQGARNILWAAINDQYKSGDYISECAVAPNPPVATSVDGQQDQARFWNELLPYLREEGFRF
ncbi:NAD(P)-binding protein [Atractiella rhizophila]|nr:NAD(P)-binding protein [Atractiella rhizophila]